MTGLLGGLSTALIPLLCALILVYGLWKRVDVYAAFVAGAGKAIDTVVHLFPVLCAMLIAVNALRASGVLGLLAQLLQPLTRALDMPQAVLPLALLRPFSGSAATAVLAELYATEGPDSFAARLGSVMMGSTETILYTLSVYLGAVGIRNGRHALPAALFAQLAGLLASLWICRLFFP